MASPILLLVLSTLLTAAAQQRTSNISLGSSLSPTSNSSFLSPSGLYAFGFYPKDNGFAIGIWFGGTPQRTVTWTANRDDPPIPSNATLVLTSGGRLVLQQSQGQETSIANSTKSAFFASMLDSGNFVLYDSDLKIIWQSFDYPTDTLLPEQLLKAGNQLVSSASETDHSTGNYRVVMQTDGNVVWYPVNSLNAPDYAYWGTSSNVVGNNAKLTLDENGRLHILNSTGFNAFNITTGGTSDMKTYRATIDVDGIFRIYSHNLDQSGNRSIEWSDPTNKCIPKGLCGINGYCVLVNQEPVCSCLPGFVFINQEKRNLGCFRNFTAETCVSRNENLKYAIQELENTTWENSRYSFSFSMTKEECNQACLEDCSCEAAQFEGGQCSKQKLPLRFGRMQQEESTVTFIKVGNGGLVDWNDTSTMVPEKSKKELQMGILITGIACLASALIVLVISGVLIFRHRTGAYREISNKANEGLVDDVTLRLFSYNELERATNSFKEKLGRGAFGTVFKGTLSNGQRVVAVKRLEKVVAEGEVEFRNEMRSIGRTHHRNLVRLLGYCHDGSNRLLVYEYMSNGSLANFLFKSEVKPNWCERIEIALNVARGILYLHEECGTKIIHCDINPNNILMDEYRCAKIADFGLAKLLMPDQTRTFTGIRGTRGYVAPEWHKNLPITVKADVYSFGIVFLEIICCRKSVDSNVPEEEAVLAEWVYCCFESNELNKLVHEDVDEQKLKRMISIGLWCIQEEPLLRPSMKKVVLMLEGTVDIPVPPSPTSFSSVNTQMC